MVLAKTSEPPNLGTRTSEPPNPGASTSEPKPRNQALGTLGSGVVGCEGSGLEVSGSEVFWFRGLLVQRFGFQDCEASCTTRLLCYPKSRFQGRFRGYFQGYVLGLRFGLQGLKPRNQAGSRAPNLGTPRVYNIGAACNAAL